MASPSRTYSITSYDATTRTLRVTASTKNPVKGFGPPTDKFPEGEPRLEVLESWDLGRYKKNNIVLLQHDPERPIGHGTEAVDGPDGLDLTITLAPKGEDPNADEADRKLRLRFLRGVSVRFDLGERTDEIRDGRAVSVFRRNLLCEVSLVTIPADEDALAGDDPTGVLSEEEERKTRASNAGRDLAKSRQYKRADAGDTDVVQRFDARGKLGKLQRTAAGGIRVPARLARTGVLVYRNPDGSIRRELRLPEEVFRAESVETLRSAPVTSMAYHQQFVDPSTWKQRALGHVENVRHDAKSFVEGDVVVNDAQTISQIENRELADTSAGYGCRIEATSGEWNGQQYDCIQRDITYNHVAVLPPGRGRSGADVGLRFDETDADSVIPTQEETMEPKKVIRLDGKDIEYGSEQHVSYIESSAQARFDAAEKSHKDALTKATADKDALQARFDAVDAENKDLKAKLASAVDTKAIDERIAARAGLLAVAGNVCGKEFRADGMSDREIRLAVVKTASAAFKDADFSKKSDDYVTALYDTVAAGIQQRADGIDSAVEQIRIAQRADATDINKGDPEAKAREEMRKRNAEAGRKPFAS